MDSNFLGRLSGLSDDQIVNMLVNENGIQLSSELMSQFTPKLCAKILMDMCGNSKNQENNMPQRCEEIDSLANLCREFLPSASPLMNIIQAIDNSSYLLSKAPNQAPPGLYGNNGKTSALPNVNSISDLDDRIGNLSLNGSVNAFNNQSRQHYTTSQSQLASQLNSGSIIGSPVQPLIGHLTAKSTQHQSLHKAHQETPQQSQQQLLQQFHQSHRDYMFDVNAIFPDPPMSVSPEIEKEAAAYFQRIYNQSINENMGIDEVLDMLRRFQASPDKRERDIFHCMIKNLFKEYCYFPQYPDKELLITAQLFGGIIQMDLVKFVALVDALTCVLEALRQPCGSKMYFFGIAALDQFKSKLKDYPLYCRHLTTIPHFNDFPLALQEYIQFGIASKDPPLVQSIDDDINSLYPSASHSPASPCQHNSNSAVVNVSSFRNGNMNNDVARSGLMMSDLINNQGVISNDNGSQENCVIGGSLSSQSEISSAINSLNEGIANDNSIGSSSPVISRPSTNRSGPSNIINNNANTCENIVTATAGIITTATSAETVQQTATEPQNHSTSDQPCHSSSTTIPTSYSDIVKRAKKVVTATNTNSPSNTNNTIKDGTKVIRKTVNNCIAADSDNVTESLTKPSGTTNGIHETTNSKRDKNGCDNLVSHSNGLDNGSNGSLGDQSESNSVNSLSNGIQNASGSNCNGNLSKLKPTNIWSYNGLRIANVSNSCSRSTLHSLFSKFGRIKLIEKINKTIENSIWVYYDNPASPVEAAHKLQGAVIEGISVNDSVPLRIYFAPTDDQKDLKFSRPKQPPDNKGECYYWRTTNCFSREQCPLLHIPANKNIDAQIWMGKMNKESFNSNQLQQQQLITQASSK